MSTTTQNALKLAIKAHNGQFRADGVTPYVMHPIEVALLVSNVGGSSSYVIAAALLHDVLEDTMVTPTELVFAVGQDGPLVLTIVEELTNQSKKEEHKHKNRAERKRIDADFYKTATIEACLIKAMDRYVNLETIEQKGEGFAFKYLEESRYLLDCLYYNKFRKSEPAMSMLRCMIDWKQKQLEKAQIERMMQEKSIS